MAYQYPEIGATNPEQTDPVPEMTYEFWVISRISSIIEQVIKERVLVPIGKLAVKGQKYSNVGGVINPLGETVGVVTHDLKGFLNQNPEFATAYNVFAEACGVMLDIVDTEEKLQASDPNGFEDLLRNLRSAYQRMDRDEDARKVTVCIQRYPGEWTMEQCLVYLGLIPSGEPED